MFTDGKKSSFQTGWSFRRGGGGSLLTGSTVYEACECFVDLFIRCNNILFLSFVFSHREDEKPVECEISPLVSYFGEVSSLYCTLLTHNYFT